MSDVNSIAPVDDVEKCIPPPAYGVVEEVTFNPITVAHSTRYIRDVYVQSTELIIAPGAHSTFSLPKLDFPNDKPEAYNYPAPHGACGPWSVQVHPEGSRYYVNHAMNAITDSDISKPKIHDLIMKGIHQILVKHSGNISKNTELYIRAEDSSNNTCGYYFIDHSTQTEFWVEPIDPEDLGILLVCSQSHLKYALQEHYWMHVEYFPHRPVSKKLSDELIASLRHGQLDHETSRSSTFPYDAEQCKRFVKLLTTAVDENSIYQTCMVARLWSSLAKHRFDNLYGEDAARPDRGTRIREKLVHIDNPLTKIASWMVFGVNKRITTEMDSVYVDDMVYTMHWRKFMRKTTDSWRDSRLQSIALIIANAVLLVQPHGFLTNYIGLAAIAVSTIAYIFGMILLQKYQDAVEHTAAEAADVLCELEHPKYRFQLVAVVYSLPKALVMWSTALLATEVFSMIVESAGVSTDIALIVVFGSIGLLVIMNLTIVLAVDLWRRRRRQYGSSPV